MKIKPHLLLLSAIALFAAGCGKEDASDNNNNNVVTDLCEGVNCPIGAGCYQGSCIDSLVGSYHWVGGWSTWQGGLGITSSGYIDDISAITRVNDSILSCRGKILSYITSEDVLPSHYYDSTKLTFFGGYVYSDEARIRFTIPYNDTAYYSTSRRSPGGGSSTSLKGVKIH